MLLERKAHSIAAYQRDPFSMRSCDANNVEGPGKKALYPPPGPIFDHKELLYRSISPLRSGSKKKEYTMRNKQGDVRFVQVCAARVGDRLKEVVRYR